MRFNQVELPRQYRPLPQQYGGRRYVGGCGAAPVALGLRHRPYILEPMTRRVTRFFVYYLSLRRQTAVVPLLAAIVGIRAATEFAAVS